MLFHVWKIFLRQDYIAMINDWKSHGGEFKKPNDNLTVVVEGVSQRTRIVWVQSLVLNVFLTTVNAMWKTTDSKRSQSERRIEVSAYIKRFSRNSFLTVVNCLGKMSRTQKKSIRTPNPRTVDHSSLFKDAGSHRCNYDPIEVAKRAVNTAASILTAKRHSSL
jgi:hypothetical protein